MRRCARTGLAAVIVSIVLVLVGAPQAVSPARAASTYRIFTPIATAPPPFWSTPELQAVDLINQHRRANGCAPAQLSYELSVAAKNHSRDMAEHNYFSHTGRNGSTFGDRARAAGYPYWPSGEIIAAGYASAQDVVNGWINSSGHRAIILDCNNDDIGIGLHVHAGSQWQYYWTGVFGQR
ncbi:MAG TPA: CAP domain-containing protein [Herpetosiphonaceae bacterium]